MYNRYTLRKTLEAIERYLTLCLDFTQRTYSLNVELQALEIGLDEELHKSQYKVLEEVLNDVKEFLPVLDNFYGKMKIHKEKVGIN